MTIIEGKRYALACNFIKGSVEGFAMETKANGEVFEGQFAQNGQNGFGIRKSDVYEYTGTWKNDKK